MEFNLSKYLTFQTGIQLFRIILYTVLTNMIVSFTADKENIMANQKHLTLDSRCTIQHELDNRNTFKGIARLLDKDNTTIAKEVKNHICFEKSGAFGKGFNDCRLSILHQCTYHHICTNCFSNSKRSCWSCGRCISSCALYEKYVCPKLSKPPYVCNGCPERIRCTLEKHLYKAVPAQNEYESLRSESRSGFALSEKELSTIDRVVSPLLKKGQSLHHIAIYHADEVMKSERSLYNYVNSGLLSARNMDMPRTVRMRPRKTASNVLKVDKSCRVGRDYDTYKKYLLENPGTPARQLDSVEGIKGGAVLLTVHFVEQELQLAFLRNSNDSQSVIDIFDKLYLELRPDIFMEVFPLLLADNGSEFSNPSAIEYDRQGSPRTKIFYCNPSAPYEKPNCENNHEMIRRIIPKGVDIGQYTQSQIDLMMSHINSYARKNMGNKSPYEVFAFQYGEELLKKFNLWKVPADEIILNPSLLKNANTK